MTVKFLPLQMPIGSFTTIQEFPIIESSFWRIACNFKEMLGEKGTSNSNKLMEVCAATCLTFAIKGAQVKL